MSSNKSVSASQKSRSSEEAERNARIDWHESQMRWHLMYKDAAERRSKQWWWHHRQSRWHQSAFMRLGGFSRVVAKVLRKHSAKIADNITKNNTLLARLKAGLDGRPIL